MSHDTSERRAEREAQLPSAARLKLARARAKIADAIEAGDGCALYGAHLLPHLNYLLPAVLGSGLTLLEITYGAMYIDQNPPDRPVHEGGRLAARQWSHTVPVSALADRIRAIRASVGEQIFLNVGAPGAMNANTPVRFGEEEAALLARAGADGLHVHLGSVEEVARITAVAHEWGLTVEAYMHEFTTAEEPFSYMGVPASSPAEAASVAASLEEVGVDILGLILTGPGDFYSMAGARDEVDSRFRERFAAARGAVRIPVSVEGQITPGVAAQLRSLGASIVVLGSLFDIAIEKAVAGVVEEFRLALGAGQPS